MRRTKIVATLGPASSSPEVIRQMVEAGMDVARLNFSHGSYDDHARLIRNLRDLSRELGKPVTILQDLQGPKIRVGQLPGGQVTIGKDMLVDLVPDSGDPSADLDIPIDYPHLADEARAGMQILLDDGLLEMKVVEVEQGRVRCRVVQGGVLKSRKGVNFPNLNLTLPSLTEKDKADLAFGLSQEVDWISLSFVRSADDMRQLRELIRQSGKIKPLIAKIEKPQALEQLEEIIEEAQGLMVARGDLGVEISPERVPLIQKRMISLCNRAGKPVITATQMLESMIHEPRPTRAEASDVANAIIDGTDCIMLSAETAAGEFPVKAVEMMDKIAREVEANIEFKTYPPEGNLDISALSEAANSIGRVTGLKCMAVLTTSGRSAMFAAAERPKIPVYALTPSLQVYHALNLLWGITPLYCPGTPHSFEDLIRFTEQALLKAGAVSEGEKILVLGGVPTGIPAGTNFLKIHKVAG